MPQDSPEPETQTENRQTRKKYYLILAVLSVIFFFVYSSFFMGRPVGFSTPDENVNFFYTKYVADNHSIVYQDPLNAQVDTTNIRPRGMSYFDGKFVPNLFFGMYFFYGASYKLFSLVGLPESTVLYLNPLLAVLGVWLLYFLVDEAFNARTAIISACLLFVLPPYWYWASFYFSNILAVVLFLAAFLFAFKALNQGRIWFYALSGLLFSLTLLVRPDFVYFLPAFLVLLLVKWRSIKVKYLGVAVGVFVISMLPLLLLNNYLYGGFLKTGQHVALGWRGIVPPAGNHPSYLGENISLLFSAVPLSIFGLGGLLYCLRKGKPYAYALSLVPPVLIFGYIFLTGQPGRFDLIVHNSYVRYFIPIYVLLVPLFVIFLLRVVRNKYIVAIALLVFVTFSVALTYPGLLDTRRSITDYSKKAESIFNETEPNSVIFVASLDKVLFPERKVAMYSFSAASLGNVASVSSRLVKAGIPVYYISERSSMNGILSGSLDANGCGMISVDPQNQLYSIRADATSP